MNREKLTAYIVFHEGRETVAYLDSEGIPTVGVGFNLKRRDARAKIAALGLDYDAVVAADVHLSDDQVLALLAPDIDTAEADARLLVENFDGLCAARQVVLCDMAFNLGRARLSGFRNMLAAVDASDWERAADEMVDSRWYRQVGRRGRRNEQAMRAGALPEL